MKKATRSKLFIGCIIIGIVIITLGVFAIWYLRSSSWVPENIRKQANFAIYIPTTQAPEVSLDRSSLKYDSQAQVLTYIVKAKGVDITVTEQAIPDLFYDVPELYGKLLQDLQPYKEIETKIGKVTLTRTKVLKSTQVAVLRSRETLLFARAQKDISDTQWQQFFNSLEVIK